MTRIYAVVAMLLGLGRVEASPDHRLEVGLRAGWNHTVVHDLENGDERPDGTGPVIDGSIGGDILPWLSIAAFASVSWFHDPYTHQYGGTSYDVRDRSIEVGPRFSVHVVGLFAGAGLAVSHVHDEIIQKSRSGDVDGTRDDSWQAKALELHFGYSTPRIRALGGIAFQLLVIKTSTFGTSERADSTRILFGLEY